MADAVLTESFERLIADAATSHLARKAEVEGDAAASWAQIEASGFADALVPERFDGFGLSLDDVFPLLLAAAEQLLPVPVGETMVGRALVRMAGFALPEDLPVLLWPIGDRDELRSVLAPIAIGQGYALCQAGGTVTLVELATDPERDGFGFLTARIDKTRRHFSFDAAPDTLMCWASALAACSAAGAINRLVAMTVQHANDRSQFGRPLAKFQALQHQISILAEQSVMATVGARLAFKDATVEMGLVPWHVAAARSVTSEAATLSAGIAHAIHGAIGVSQEHELQAVTRRLKRLQLCFGSRQYWATQVGAARIEARADTSVDFIRNAVSN